jgi:hypothetical protein
VANIKDCSVSDVMPCGLIECYICTKLLYVRLSRQACDSHVMNLKGSLRTLL